MILEMPKIEKKATSRADINTATDEILFIAYREGNTRAFEVLFSRYQDRLCQHMERLLNNQQAGEDLSGQSSLDYSMVNAGYVSFLLIWIPVKTRERMTNGQESAGHRLDLLPILRYRLAELEEVNHVNLTFPPFNWQTALALSLSYIKPFSGAWPLAIVYCNRNPLR